MLDVSDDLASTVSTFLRAHILVSTYSQHTHQSHERAHMLVSTYSCDAGVMSVIVESAKDAL